MEHVQKESKTKTETATRCESASTWFCAFILFKHKCHNSYTVEGNAVLSQTPCFKKQGSNATTVQQTEMKSATESK